MRAFATVLVALGLAISMTAGRAAAQREADFWREYKAAFDDPSGGFAKKRDLVQNNRNYIQGMVTYQIFSIANSWIAKNEEDVQDRLKLLDDLSRMCELVFRSKIIEPRLEYAKTLNPEKSQAVVDANQAYLKLIQMHNSQPKSPQMVEQVIGDGMRAIEDLKGAGEDYILGDVAEFISRYQHMKEDYLAEAELLSLAKQCFTRHKRTEMENHVALQLRKLEGEPYNIKLGKPGGEGPAVERKTVKERREPKKFDPVPMKYKTDKGPGAFDSPAWLNGFDHMLWRGIGVEKGKPANWPLGDGSVVTWEGGTKLFLDVDNTGKKLTRLKSTAGTQNVIDIPVKYARGSGKYRVILRGLGEREKFLGEDFNFNSSTQVFVQIARACHMEGSFNGVRFSLIDDNVNGKYDDFGSDTVAIGKEPVQPLSPIMDFGGTLYSVYRVKPDGSEVYFQEYVGDTGKVQFNWTGGRGVNPEFLIVVCVRGEFTNCFFNVAGGKPVTVPNGFYQFARGMLTLGSGKKMRFATIEQGKSEVFEVEENKTTVKELGAPFDVMAGVSKGDEGLQIKGKDIKIYGAMKERYHHFYPDSFTPVISVRHAGGGARVLPPKKVGRPAGQVQLRDMWYPRSLDFHGTIDKRYEVKIDVNNPFLGKVKGNWNEAETLIEQ